MSAKAGIDQITNILAVGSGKGGVGKSTVTTNLARSLASMGKKVGLLDADLYGPSQPKMMGDQSAPKGDGSIIIPVEKDGVKFVSMGLMNPSGKALIIRSPLAIKAIQQFLLGVAWGELDYLLIDLPPGTGDIQLTLAQQAKLSGAIIVTTPQQVASEIAKKGLEMFETVNVPVVGIIENMSGYSCPNCDTVTPIFGKNGGKRLSENFNVPLLGSIPLDPMIMMDADRGEMNYAEDLPHIRKFKEITKTLDDELTNAQEQAKLYETEEMSITDSGMKVTWTDGKSVELDAHKVRLECPCASCVNEHTGEKMITSGQIPANIKILGLSPVGRYGVAINFSDGHKTGIYKFKTLKEMSSTSDDSFSV